MKFLRNLVIGLIGLVVILAASAYLLPRHVVVERSIAVEAPPETVFPLINSLKRGAEWSPWLARDPQTKLTFGGPDEGVGANMHWESDHPQVGNGSQQITLSRANERVESALDFGAQGPATAWFDLVPDGTGTLLTWGLDADMGMNPIGRWMGLMMDGWVGPDYERGLANIKALAEG